MQKIWIPSTLVALTLFSTIVHQQNIIIRCHALSNYYSSQPKNNNVKNPSNDNNAPNRKLGQNNKFTTDRRSILIAANTLSKSFLLAPLLYVSSPSPSNALSTPPPLLSSSSSPSSSSNIINNKSNTIRIEEIGGGFDLLSPPTSSSLTSSDAFYPSSMTNTQWRVQRVITSIEGDLNQASIVWKCLGGGNEKAFTSKLTEVYNVRYIEAPQDVMKDGEYEFDGRRVRASILDRGYEIQSRVGGGIVVDSPVGEKSNSISWDPRVSTDTLTYARNNNDNNDSNSGTIELKTVQRKIEPPSEMGFGSDELIRIQSSAGGMLDAIGGIGGSLIGGSKGSGSTAPGNNVVYRCARVKRRFRRGFDESTGKRIIDGIEIVTTYRVLDGVAGVEMPTSTCKSRIRMTQL